MFLKWLRKDEQGSVMVIVAIAMVVLMGFTGLAVDYGAMAMTRQDLQNAADAAALAAGQVRMNGEDTTTAAATANQYILANGFTPGDGVTISNISFGTDTVTVELQTQKKVAISSVMTGRNTETISVRAVAQSTTSFGNFPYALFAGAIKDSGLVVNGNGNESVTVVGNMHSNSSIDMKHANVTGMATAVGNITIKSGQKAEETLVIEMPTGADLINHIKNSSPYTPAGGDYTGSLEQLVVDALAAGQPVNGAINIYIQGSAKLTSGGGLLVDGEEVEEGSKNNGNGNGNGNGNNKNDEGGDIYHHDSPWPINLLVAQELDFSKATLTSEDKCPYVFISENAGIIVNGCSANAKDFHGVIFAPKGDVEFNGNTVNITGCVIAQNITKNGGSFTVTYSGYMDDHLPHGKVRLIE